MFGHLSSFGRQNTMGQAFGFYLFYAFAGTIGIAVLCQIADELGAKGADRAVLASALAVGLTALLSLLVLRAKGHLHDVGYLLLTMLGMAGALAGGILFQPIVAVFASSDQWAGAFVTGSVLAIVAAMLWLGVDTERQVPAPTNGAHD